MASFMIDGYEAQYVESPITGQYVWRVATPARVRLRGEYDTVDEALDAICDHEGKPHGSLHVDVEPWRPADALLESIQDFLADWDDVTEAIKNWNPKENP